MGKKSNQKSIIITGFPYAYPYYFKVFEYVESKDNLIFILPKRWEAKKGKVKIGLAKRADFKIFGLSACSFGGKSLFGGLFKGWTPFICLILPYVRLKYGSRVLYSCLEPNLLTTLYNGFWAKLFGYKHVLFTWQNVAPEKRMSGLKLKLSNMLVKLNLALSDGIICGNTKAAEIINKLKIVNCKLKIIVCPLSGVDTEKFKPVGNEQIQQAKRSNDKIILFYGALEKRKGIDVLINAFNILNTKYLIHDTKLVIVGTGPESESLKLKVSAGGGSAFGGKSLKLDEKTVFLDWMTNDELPALLNSADVFVYPSRRVGGWEEQFGYAMAEASACGVPVVATKTGSIDEVVVDGKSGILVEPNNSEQLAEAMNKILSDSNLAKQMGEFGRNYVVENFSHEVIAKKIIYFLRSF
ncbi:MAG TPA: glycosyltransferase family 4 protein [Candidatus Paceibacterota bacterium]|nr:glycosyltransferase family 4 protein [Candidatus Paceibacterota bacterium]